MAREPVSVVCVFNDEAVLDNCLRSSFASLLQRDGESELIAVDNTKGQFPTAGAALGHGATRARHRVVAFAHQDVVLHSLEALEEAAAKMVTDPSIGMAGCCGIDARGLIHGRIRDRVVLIGSRVDHPTPVDSLDEVLFMLRAADLRSEPLANSPDLAWHAYAVEYGLRVRAAGKSVVALDIPVTHNSLTVNLDRLDVAHARVASLYPEATPVRTTCGVVRSAAPQPSRLSQLLQPHRWRYRWLRESLIAHRGARRTGSRVVVLSDIRLDIDDILNRTGSISVVNVDDGTFDGGRDAAVAADRRGRPVLLRAGSLEFATHEVQSRACEESLLVTNLGRGDLSNLASCLRGAEHLLGFATDLGFWILLGPAARQGVQTWSGPRSRPALHNVLRR